MKMIRHQDIGHHLEWPFFPEFRANVNEALTSLVTTKDPSLLVQVSSDKVKCAREILVGALGGHGGTLSRRFGVLKTAGSPTAVITIRNSGIRWRGMRSGNELGREQRGQAPFPTTIVTIGRGESDEGIGKRSWNGLEGSSGVRPLPNHYCNDFSRWNLMSRECIHSS